MLEHEILKAEKVCFSYSRHKSLLNDFSMSVNQGEFLGLIGPNGSGKTTIFKLLNGYLKPRSGRVMLDGKALAHTSNRERAAVMAVVPQFITTPMPFTVKQIVEMGRTARASRFLPLRQADHTAVNAAIDELDLNSLSNEKFNCLSGGERQRTMIAAALAQEPKILLLDEPTASLDLGHKIRLMRSLCGLLKKGITILTISHDIELMGKYCQRLLLLKNGAALAVGKPEEIITPELIAAAYNCKVEIVPGPRQEPLLAHD